MIFLLKERRSKEGRLQVSLAQMQFLLPRLAGQWSHLERLGGRHRNKRARRNSNRNR
ncbi:MAG: hypothetical protein ACJ0HA_03855 [Dehalococcoidia bacterium]